MSVVELTSYLRHHDNCISVNKNITNSDHSVGSDNYF